MKPVDPDEEQKENEGNNEPKYDVSISLRTSPHLFRH